MTVDRFFIHELLECRGSADSCDSCYSWINPIARSWELLAWSGLIFVLFVVRFRGWKWDCT